MKALNITIMFDGKTEAAFNFYKSVIGGEFSHFQRMKDIPNAPAMPAEEGEKILHIALPVGGGAIAGMDMPLGRGTVNAGNNL